MLEFTYHAPRTLAEALMLLAEQGHTASCLAGGTDLVLAMERRRIARPHVVDLKRIPDLHGSAPLPGGGQRIGALTTMSEIESHADWVRDYPALVAAAAVVGGPAIRNRATLGGNLCNASPAADTATPLVALGAELELAGCAGTRTVPIARFWLGPGKTVLAPGELLIAVRLAAPAPRSGNAFQRVTRTAMDIALVNAAAEVTLDAASRVARLALALGAAGPTVLEVHGLDAVARGRTVDAALLDAVAERARAAARPRDDVRASAEYRADQCGVLARRAVLEAARRARDTGSVRS
jgi:carbon-monoxide dehydrogenase medium subunit